MVKFIDEIQLHVEAGAGGAGCLSFRRERCLPKGGPDGGDGGEGGGVYLEADDQLATLVDLRHRSIFKAQPGRPGSGQHKTGMNGEPCVIKVPVGTTVYDADSEHLLVDLVHAGQRVCVAQGGARGLGNVHFKTSRHRAPRECTQGESGESRRLRLELKLLAEVGLVGLPNAGKSSLIRAVSAARPRVADYPFTTTRPYLGWVHIDAERQFVLADIPGLVQGAASGVGLGDQFLKHLARCSVLLHIVSVYEVGDYDVLSAIEQVVAELKASSKPLDQKPRWLILSKIDLISDEALAQLKAQIKAKFSNITCFEISAHTRAGLDALCCAVSEYLEQSKNLT